MPRTSYIAPVHNYGLDCEMDSVMTLALQHGLKVVEDPAQRVCRPTKSGCWEVLVT